ncbi:chemokine-binding protein [Bovine papular stomatitis virus]
MKVSYLIFVLSLAFSSVLSLTLDPRQQRDWCKVHHDKLYSKFRLYMKITKQDGVEPLSGMCALDIENTNMTIPGSKRRTSLNDSTATFDANGVNGTVTLMGDKVQIPFSYVGVSYDLKGSFIYVNVSSWNPWEKTTEDLLKNRFAGLKNLVRHQILAISLGCNCRFPTPTPTPEQITTPEVYEYYEYDDGSGLPTTPEPPRTRLPVDTYSNRKRKPEELDFSLKVDGRCIKEVDLYFELKDACLHYKRHSPFSMFGTHGTGDQVRRETKALGSEYRTCRMNASPEEENVQQPRIYPFN